MEGKAIGEAGSGAALVTPQYGFKHSHVKAGGGTYSHAHAGKPGHGHAADAVTNDSGVALLPMPNGGKGYTAEQRREMADKGEALPDGSYPIKNAEDLKSAIHLYGNGNAAKSDVKAHIVKRAKALGLTNMLPDDWTTSGKTYDSFAIDWGFKSYVAESGDLILTGYGNTWELDRDGEKTARNAFDESLEDYLTLNPIVCYEHDMKKGIGYVRKANTDDIGLKIEAVIPKPPEGSEPWHIKAYNDIKRGVNRTFSMGGRFMRDASRTIIEKVQLLEMSVVGVPSNPISIFEVAEAKGLQWEEDEKRAGGVIEVGVGTGHGRHHHGALGPRKGRTRRRATGTTRARVHRRLAAGVHRVVRARRTGSPPITHRVATSQHRSAAASHAAAAATRRANAAAASLARRQAQARNSTPYTDPGLTPAQTAAGIAAGKPFADRVGGKALSALDAEAENEVNETLDGGDVSALLEGLIEALEEVSDSDMSDQLKVENVDEIFEDFIDEAEKLGVTLDDSEDANESEDLDTTVGKAVSGLLSTKAFAPLLGARINNALTRARKRETGMANETENPQDDEGKSVTEFEAMKRRLATLEQDRKNLELEKKAEEEATKALEREAAEAKALEEQKAKDEKALQDKIAEAVARQRSTFNSGTKYTAPVSVAPGDTSNYKHMGEWLRDVKNAKKGDFNAFQRLQEQEGKSLSAWGTEGKALGEGTNAGGGYLVPPQYWQQGLAEYRIAVGKLRALCTALPAGSDLVLIPRETGFNTVGWVAEGATKPSQDQTFGQLAVGIYPLAGITKVSNQMLQDSSPAIDTIAKKDLGRGIGQQEDIAFIMGSGSNQPLGILNTPGVLSLAATATTGNAIADAIAAAVTAVQSNFFSDPTGVLAHPRDLQKLRIAKDTGGRYLLEPAFSPALAPQGAGAGALLGANVSLPVPQGMMWGLPVYSDANIPVNQGAGTNETRIIVAAFNEDYVLDREGVRIDVSSEAGTSFEQNQTWFRGEERVGFTAGRQPTANCFITGLAP